MTMEIADITSWIHTPRDASAKLIVYETLKVKVSLGPSPSTSCPSPPPESYARYEYKVMVQ